MNLTPANLEKFYVVDTHPLIWYLKSDKRLSSNAHHVLASAEAFQTRIGIPAIALAEMYFVNKKHHYFTDFTQIYRQILARPEFRLLDFRATEVLDFDANHLIPDIHDRIIVGVAKRFNVPLITADQNIRDSGLVQIVW